MPIGMKKTAMGILFKMLFLFSFLFLVLPTETVFAEKKEVLLNIRADVRTLSKLEVDQTTVVFDLGSLSPDDAPVINANPAQINITLKTRTGANSNVTLNILATGDIVSGTDVIPVNNINWIATGAGFVGGTLDKMSPQKVGSWTGGGVRSGTLAFRMFNRWEYVKGEYGTTSLFILTTP